MSVTLRLGTPFRDIIGGKSEIVVRAESVEELFERMEKKYPGFKKMVFDRNGKIWQHSNVYVNGNDIRGLNNLETQLKDGDIVAILFALAGG